ncbi:tubulin binding cofactor A, variant [Sphaeroforma arctica JP610]|nr:tubulin binding cofactor A, variant [Sphaeroforma arctica JP610]KNC75959.1 tubulin binding cofactor A, variant [Sphaeroforma arctica JP610]|eukprot:XP_014149861.1 tubulin binding cofactor A, variant [Sphaeroforma arctica JP610]
MRMYTEEEVAEVKIYDQWKADGVDEYKLRQQANVVEETRAMIPHTKNRLDDQIESLAALLLVPGYEDTEQVKTAKEVLLLAQERADMVTK